MTAALAVAVLTVSACGGDDTGDSPSTAEPADTPTSTAASTTTAPTTPPDAPLATDAPPSSAPVDEGAATTAPVELDPEAPDLGRVVALAEEFILADVLALGVEPIASSASVEAAGFQGLDEYDTSGIEVLPMTTLDLERLAALQPDTIVTLQFWVDQVGDDLLSGIADVIAIPDGLYGRERLSVLGELLGRPEHAEAVAAELDAAEAQARDRIGEGCALSLAAIYSGPTIAAFVAGPWDLPSAILAAGCEIVPGPEQVEPDSNGRAWLSLEQLGMLDQELLVLLQNDTVEGESASVEEVESSPLWPSLPAVQAGNVVVFDRLGYPGATGTIRFLDEFSAMLD